MMMGYS
jgi:hypothetical protein